MVMHCVTRASKGWMKRDGQSVQGIRMWREPLKGSAELSPPDDVMVYRPHYLINNAMPRKPTRPQFSSSNGYVVYLVT